MEADLFEWSAWDLVTDTILQFYGCVLKVPIGQFKVGDTVPIILVDFERGILQLHDKGKTDSSGDGSGGRALLSEHRVRMVLMDAPV